MKKLYVFLSAAVFGWNAVAQLPTIEPKGTITLSVAPGAPYGLGGRYSMSVHKLIYSPDLSFVGRQTSDNSYLHIDLNVRSVHSVEIENAFFIFRGSSNPVQFLYSKGYANRKNTSNFDSVFYYNFQHQQVVGAVAYQNAFKNLLAGHSGVIDLDGQNNTLMLHWLQPSKSDDFFGVKLVPPGNANQQVLSFKSWRPASWQTISYSEIQSEIKFSIPTKATYTSSAGWDMDINREYLLMKATSTLYWDVKQGKEIEFKGDERNNSALLAGGKLALEENEKGVVNGNNTFYTVIKIYDLRTGKVDKVIELPGKRLYEVFFSKGNLAMFYDKNPNDQKYTPYLIDLETSAVLEIPLNNPLEPLFVGKKKFKGNLTQLQLAANLQYNIKQVAFSDDLKRMFIASYMDLSSAEDAVAYTVGGMRHYKEEIIDVYDLKW
jgi:hypothetical protein